VNLIQQVEAGNKKSKLAQVIEDFAKKLRAKQKIAQAATASAQQRMKDSANKTRQQAIIFRKNDHVWLSLKNIKTL
jgi:ABC-type Zn uptake system ZnuABC Zn-binding protein ZnuA